MSSPPLDTRASTFSAQVLFAIFIPPLACTSSLSTAINQMRLFININQEFLDIMSPEPTGIKHDTLWYKTRMSFIFVFALEFS